MKGAIASLIVLASALTAAAGARAQSLRGSPHSMAVQNAGAHRNDFTYIRTPAQLRKFVRLGLLVELPGNDDYGLDGVSFPYARPEVKTFVERLSREYHNACGERLIVTSATRPVDDQPANASEISVHPTGMALDLRVSDRYACRSWLARVLLQLEDRGVLEATREHYPPHFHLAVFPKRYYRYVAQLERKRQARTALASTADGTSAGSASNGGQVYRVQNGDSLWSIAQDHGTTVRALKELNNLNGSRIDPGQMLRLPSAS